MGVKSVSVIGATGYLGSRLCTSLSKAGINVRGWGRSRPASEALWLESINEFNTGDVTDDQTLRKIVAEGSDAILYCVSMDHHKSELDIDRAMKTNVQPVWRMLEYLSQKKDPVRFIYLSTSQVYGNLAGKITEKSPVHPGNHYGLTHLMAENVVCRYRAEMNISGISLRLSNGYGAPLFEDANCWWLVINDFCRLASEQGKIQLNSGGLQQRNFVHIKDICQAVELIIKSPVERLDQPVYNVGGEISISILELAHQVAVVYQHITGKDVPVYLPGGVISESNGKPESSAVFNYSIDAISQLGYVPNRKLGEGIREVLEFVMSRGEK